MFGARLYQREDFEEAVRLVADGSIPARRLISETGTELGQALGIAALGSIGAVLYRGHLTPYVKTLDAERLMQALDAMGHEASSAGHLWVIAAPSQREGSPHGMQRAG